MKPIAAKATRGRTGNQEKHGNTRIPRLAIGQREGNGKGYTPTGGVLSEAKTTTGGGCLPSTGGLTDLGRKPGKQGPGEALDLLVISPFPYPCYF